MITADPGRTRGRTALPVASCGWSMEACPNERGNDVRAARAGPTKAGGPTRRPSLDDRGVGPAGPPRDGDGDDRPFRWVLSVLPVPLHEVADRPGHLGGIVDDGGPSVRPHPPQAFPVVLIVVGERRHL